MTSADTTQSTTWSGTKEAKAAFARYSNVHQGEIDAPDLADAMFKAGVAYAIKKMTGLSDLSPVVYDIYWMLRECSDKPVCIRCRGEVA